MMALVVEGKGYHSLCKEFGPQLMTKAGATFLGSCSGGAAGVPPGSREIRAFSWFTTGSATRGLQQTRLN